jgi:hypothetical protein
VDHPLRPFTTGLSPRSWRLVALVAVGFAAVELILLVVAGSALLTGDSKPAARVASSPAPAVKAKKQTATPAHNARHTASALPARSKVSIMVLNGNGRPGAAAAGATRIRQHGYRIRFVGNASRMDYRRSIVMYRPGYQAEGRRLGRDLGIRLVGPLDGVRPRQLHGAQAVVVIGA